MPSTFFGLQIAYSGLKASNAALNTTANNVANVETDGYSRQKVITAASDPMRVFATYGCAGAGVDTLAIERVRDVFYDEKFRDNETRYGEFERKEYYMTVMETYFKDDGKTGFKSIFNKLIETLEEVTKNASSTSTKATFLSQAKTMTDYFNNMAGDLQDLQKDINDEIKVQTSQINSIAEELATINKQINVIELTGTTANELRDKRDLLVDELSQYVDVQVKETPIYNAQNEETGATRCIVQIAGGQTLVDQNEFRTLEVVARASYEKVYQTDADGLYDVYWSDGQQFKLDNAAMGGSLKGLADLRDGNNGNYFSGMVTDVTTVSEGGTLNHVVTIEADGDMLTSLDRCNLSNTGGRIILGNQEYYYKDWTVNYVKTPQLDENGDPVLDGGGNPIMVDTDEVESYVFTMDDAKCDQVVTGSKIGKMSMMGSFSEYQGIPYYMSQMNEWVRIFSKSMNDIFTSGWTTKNEDAGIVFTGSLPTERGEYSEDTLNNTDVPTDNRGYYHITALNCTVESAVNEDPDLLGSRKDVTNGVEECDNIKKAIEVLGDKTQLSFRSYNASGFLESVLSDVALNTGNARTFSATFLSLQAVLDNQRTAVTGVDSDEEAVNLVKYENAYTLSSKMIQTFQEIYDRLILQTGV